MKRVIFTLIAGTVLIAGQVSADLIEPTTGTSMVPVPMVAGVTYTITGGTDVGSDAAVADPTHPWMPAGDRYFVNDGSTFMIEFSQPIPANFVALRTRSISANAAQTVGTLSVDSGTAGVADFAGFTIVGPDDVGTTYAGGDILHPGGGTGRGQIHGTSSVLTVQKLTLSIPVLPDDNTITAAWGFNKTAIMAAVPEPSSLMFLGLVVTGLGVRRRYSK